MAFTGKATYSGGSTLPEHAEDVSDLIGILSMSETPLLDWLGDPRTEAHSTRHEWMEDSLLPNHDQVSDTSISGPGTDTQFDVAHGDRFRPGDLIRIDANQEMILVTGVAGDTLTTLRGYGGTTIVPLVNNKRIDILGNAALEGADRPATRFTTRQRKSNWTQIFTASVEVSGTQLAVDKLAVADELDHQKMMRLRELVRDLENCLINGVPPAAVLEGSATVRRTMAGIIHRIQTNRFTPGEDEIPQGGGAGNDELTEAVLNAALRRIWSESGVRPDTIVVNGAQKRRINQFITASRRYTGGETRYRDHVATYESDFGVCRIILSRWMPENSLLMLDRSRLQALPLAGRAFHYKPLASDGDKEVGQVIGEYTVELRNENAHGLIEGLSAA